MNKLETATQRIAELEAELAAMRAVGEPVAWQYRSKGESAWFDCAKERVLVRANHPDKWELRALYTHPQPAAQDAERKWADAFRDARDMVLQGRGPLEDAGMDSDRTNAVLAVLDECFHFAFEPAAAITTQGEKE